MVPSHRARSNLVSSLVTARQFQMARGRGCSPRPLAEPLETTPATLLNRNANRSDTGRTRRADRATPGPLVECEQGERRLDVAEFAEICKAIGANPFELIRDGWGGEAPKRKSLRPTLKADLRPKADCQLPSRPGGKPPS